MSAVRILGIGSPHGDDRVGWAVLDALREVPMPAGTELHRIAAPAAELLPLLLDARRVIIVDAIASGAAPGRVVRCDPRELRRADGGVSGHGLSVDSALDLAAALGGLPEEVVLIGLSVDPATSLPAGEMTRPVVQGLPLLVAEVAREAGAEAVPA